MNNDLISRSALLESIKQLAKDIARENGGVDHVTYAMKVAFDMAKEAPAVDAEPVIRCMDCEFSRLVHREDGSVLEGTLHCFTGRGYQQNVFGREYSVISPNNFCASGRRKMDADKAKAGE